MSHRRRSGSSSQQPSPGAGPSGSAPDLRRVARIVHKGAGGFEVEPADFILNVSSLAYRSRMTAPWPTWDQIPSEEKNAIWADLMAAVRVKPDDMDVFTNHWNKRMRKIYRETLSRAKLGQKKPGWMGAEVWAGFLSYWEREEVKELAKRNSANRNKNPAKHRGGSKSFQEHRRELAALWGREPTMAEVFRVTHAVEEKDDEGNVSYDWSDDKARKVMERYEAEEERVMQSSGRQEVTFQESNYIWNAIVDEATRNRRYSFGNQEALDLQEGYRKSQDQAVIDHLQQQIDELKANWQRCLPLEQQRDEAVARFFEEHGVMPWTGDDDADDEDYEEELEDNEEELEDYGDEDDEDDDGEDDDEDDE